MTTSNDPDQSRRHRTDRAELSDNVDALADTANPKKHPGGRSTRSKSSEWRERPHFRVRRRPAR